jgi:hypothetical protein
MKKRLLFFAAVLLCAPQAFAKNVMCLKTNTGQYIEMARVSMMVVPDGGSTFEIVVKDGEGATNVESISFEKHESDIDLSKYSGGSSDSDTPDMSKPVFLLTNTGKYFYMKDLPKLNAKDGSDKIDVEVGGQTEKDVAYVYFYRGPEENLTAIDKVKTAPAEENLVLSTPVSSQLQISGCGAATKAVIYSANGQMMTEASVCNGVTTINVEQLIKGIYIVKVGKKALKFIKK